MNHRYTILAWSERGAIANVRAALGVAGALPAARDWRTFLDALLLWSGAVALAAAVVFFIAHNWAALGKLAKFGLVELPLLAAVLGYWRLGPNRPAGKASLLVASILVGALLALFGQTYQTGADTWELFASWAALLAPWVVIGRFPGLWMLWLAIANVAIVLYFQVFPGVLGIVFGAERQLWTLFGFNTTALVGWELAARRIVWLDERWAPRLLAAASGTTVTVVMLQTIFSWDDAGGIAAILYPLWLVGVYGAYRLLKRDLAVLAGGCLSVIVVVTGLLIKGLAYQRVDAGSFLFIAIAVVSMGAGSGWWLKQVAGEAER